MVAWRSAFGVWRRDQCLGVVWRSAFGVWHRDRCWAVSLPWVLFRFAVGLNRCGFGCGVEIGVGLWICLGFCLGLSWVAWVRISVGDRCIGLVFG